jgi:DNA-directed RNA polymerase specialized sigma24 family protein
MGRHHRKPLSDHQYQMLDEAAKIVRGMLLRWVIRKLKFRDYQLENDLASAAFARLLVHCSKAKRCDMLFGFLKTLSQNVVKAHFRDKRAGKRAAETVEYVEETSDEPSQALTAMPRTEPVDRSLPNASEIVAVLEAKNLITHRQACCYLSTSVASRQEIASQLNVSLSVIRAEIEHVRKIIQKYLKEL